MTAIPQHSSASNEHYSPSHVVEAARSLLGGFDLDPASCAEANETVKASAIFTIDDDGLTQPWHGRVFLNPPGGRLKRVGDKWVPVKGGKAESSMKVWWDRLSTEWAADKVEQAFFVAFTLEILRTSQYCALPVQAFPRCYPKDRLCFGGDDPTHANVLIWLPPRPRFPSRELDDLRQAFGRIGLCEGGY
jgi:hypothetical protein